MTVLPQGAAPPAHSALRPQRPDGAVAGVLAFAVSLLLGVAVGAAGFALVRPPYEAWRSALASAQADHAAAAAEAAERAARQKAAEDAAAAAQAAMAASAQQRRSAPYAQPAPGGGYNPLAARPAFNPLSPSPIPPGPSFANPDVPLNPAYGNLPDTDGVDVVYYACTACHSVQTFAAQHVTRERWDDLLDWMVTDQSMRPLPPADRAIVLDYLVRHFGADHQAPGTLSPTAATP